MELFVVIIVDFSGFLVLNKVDCFLVRLRNMMVTRTKYTRRRRSLMPTTSDPIAAACSYLIFGIIKYDSAAFGDHLSIRVLLVSSTANNISQGDGDEALRAGRQLRKARLRISRFVNFPMESGSPWSSLKCTSKIDKDFISPIEVGSDRSLLNGTESLLRFTSSHPIFVGKYESLLKLTFNSTSDLETVH
nr:hypothetical protein Iba_chr01fCG5430 [Ipomoea batatas]